MYRVIIASLLIISNNILFSHSATQNLTVIGLLPLSGKNGNLGHSVKPHIERAVDNVNSNSSLLPNYNLVVEWVDSKCDVAFAIKAIFEILNSKERLVYVYGGYCSSVTKSIAESVSYFKLWQISFLNTDPTLSDIETYRNFLRVIPNELDFNLIWIKFLLSNHWKTTALLFQDASSGVATYAYTHNELISLLKDADINITTIQSVTENPAAALNKIIQLDARIIIGNFDHLMARRIICMSYHLGVFGHKYVWLLSQASTYPQDWWNGSENCTNEQMEEVLDGHFTVDIVSSYQSHAIASSYNYKHQRPYELKNIRHMKPQVPNRYAGYAYDGVLLMAHSLHRFVENSNSHLPEWSEWYNLTNSSFITEESFAGNTGNVKFSGRSRLGHLQLKQRQNNAYTEVGQLDMASMDLKLHKQKIYWHGYGKVPIDQLKKVTKLIKPDMIIHSALKVMASLGLLLAISFLGVNIKYTSHRHIKMSSPRMNNVIVVGCILIYCTVFILRIDPWLVTPRTLQIICIARTWSLSFGFSLSFGALFAKTWRVYTIFNSLHTQKRLITDAVLSMVVVALLVLDLILLITWVAVDPLEVRRNFLAPYEEENTLITGEILTCKSTNMNIWTATVYAYKGVLLVVGCFFAWQTRHVNIPALNDSKYIGMSVYNVVIMCTSAVAISYVISNKPDHSDLIIGLLIILCTTITLCLVFVPKIMHLRQDPTGRSPRPRLSMRTSSSSRKSMLPTRPSVDGLNTVEQQISQLEHDLVLNQAKLNMVTQELNNLNDKCKTTDMEVLAPNQLCPSESLPLEDTSDWCEPGTTAVHISISDDSQMNGYHMGSHLNVDN